MVEETIIDWLISASVASGNVFAEFPVDPPDEFVVVESTDTTQYGLIDSDPEVEGTTINIESFSSVSLYRAASLNKSVQDAMEPIDDGDDPEVLNCDFMTSYRSTEQNQKLYAYTSVYGIGVVIPDVED